jgi:uncharacterized repeat protein (TIGR03803 family)
LVLLGSALYGTTADCGGSGHGTVFAVATNGTGFNVLHTFTGGVDGANPWAGLILSGNNTTLYGTAYSGGAFGHGTVFAINADGTGFTSLYSFTGGNDGAGPIGGLTLSGGTLSVSANTLSGTAELGGSSGNGTVFSVSFTPQLSVTSFRTNIVLTWPTNYAGFDYSGYTLQSTTNLSPVVIWHTSVPIYGPVVVNGQNTVTNSISETRQFYRLSLPVFGSPGPPGGGGPHRGW